MFKGIVIGSNNKGKINEISAALSELKINILSLNDVGFSLKVDETGESIGENAYLKANAYSLKLPEYIVLSDDTGLEISALNGKPGLHVRRWKGYEMEDEEIISFALEKLRDIPIEKRNAQFKSVIALAVPGKKMIFFEGVLNGKILIKPLEIRMEGFPFDPLFYCTDWNLTLGEIHLMDYEKRQKLNILTHRELALIKVKEYLKKIL